MLTGHTTLAGSLAVLMALSAVLAMPRAVSAQAGKTEKWNAPARAVRKKNPVSPTGASIQAGESLFQQICAVCHGTKAKGNGPAAPGLTPKPRDLTSEAPAKQVDGELFWKIRVGRTPMPAFGPVLKENQVWNLVNYIRSLQPQQPGKPKGQKGKSATDKSPATGTDAGEVRGEKPAKSAGKHGKPTNDPKRTKQKSN